MKSDQIDRREFLRFGVAGVSVASTFPLFLGKTALAAAASPPSSDRVLVVLQLSGGNDGLSTVVPYSDPAYGRARRASRIGEKEVLRLNERVGLHPNLKELKELYGEGRVAIVQGASYPNPTRSHFEAMDIWHAGDRKYLKNGTGWLGRAVDCTCGNGGQPEPLLSVNLGGSLPRALTGERSKPVAFGNPGAYQWRGKPDQTKVFEAMNSPSPAGPEPVGQLDYLRRVALDARNSSEVIRKAAREYTPAATYPGGNRLANELRTVAGLIAARLPTRIYYVSLGGFDTHSNQKPTHDTLMRVLSTALSAFLKDLKAQDALDRVLCLTFSEFGRRVNENGSGGTDHGVAAPMFLLGGRVQGGLQGRHPSLTELVGGDLAMGQDFRQVYATVLDRWLGISSEKVLGTRYAPLPLIQEGPRARAF
jgi:uncharacterized protein (DUF1501 family)